MACTPDFRSCALVQSFAVLCSLLFAPAVNGQSLSPIAGSPFVFSSPSAGDIGDVVLLSSDQRHLFVSNRGSSSITVLRVAEDGTLTLVGRFPSTAGCQPMGLVTNPSGDRLYVIERGCGIDPGVTVYAVTANGSLTRLRRASLRTTSFAENSIAYVSLPGGDFVYVNNDQANENTVSVFRVESSDGTLVEPARIYPTGGAGSGGWIGFASPRLRATAGTPHRLFVVNQGSNNVSSFEFRPDGSLAPAPGSPFSTGTSRPVALAVGPGGDVLYVGTVGSSGDELHDPGTVAKYSIDPDGGLTFITEVPSGLSSFVDGLELHPSGDWIAVTTPFDAEISVLKTATMTTGGVLPGGGCGAAAGVVFNRSGDRLFLGEAVSPGTCVSVYHVESPRPTALDAIGDAYVRAGAFANVNFGTTTDLRVKRGISPDNTRRSYLKFAVTAIKSGDRVTLRLNGHLSNTANVTARTVLYAVSDTSWDEHAITWNTRPDLGAVLATLTVTGTANQTFDIDVTRYVQRQKQTGHDLVSFALRNPAHTSAQVIFASRERGQAGPRLLIMPKATAASTTQGDAVAIAAPR